NHAPVVSVPSANVSASAGQTIQASTLFSASDQDGDALTYYLYDATRSAERRVGDDSGTPVAAGTTYTNTAGQLGQSSFVNGTDNDDLFIQATDGSLLSNTGHFTINVGSANHAPVVSVPSANVSASAGQTIQASTLFSASDQDGDALTYYLYDAT